MRISRRFLSLAGVCAVLLLIAVAGIYGWRYIHNPCEVDAVKDSSEFLISQLKTYDGQYQFTTTVYREGLSRPVNVLQQIFMDTQSVEVPACMQTAQDELIGYMGAVIAAFDAYRSGEPDAAIRDLLRQSDLHYANFRSELRAVKECTPFCLP
jgi:hypothetical protein